MKLRIVKDGNEKYYIQEKKSLFSRWERIEMFDTLLKARERCFYLISSNIKDIIYDYKSKKITILEKFITKEI